MRVYKRAIEVSFKVDGLLGKLSIGNKGSYISASTDIKQFLREGKTVKSQPSYIEVKNPSAEFIAEVFSRIADYENNPDNFE